MDEFLLMDEDGKRKGLWRLYFATAAVFVAVFYGGFIGFTAFVLITGVLFVFGDAAFHLLTRLNAEVLSFFGVTGTAVDSEMLVVAQIIGASGVAGLITALSCWIHFRSSSRSVPPDDSSRDPS